VAGSIIPSAHGNRLVDRFVVSDKKNMQDMYTLQVSNELRNDIENIADGIFSPLEGFVGEDDFRSVVKRGRLSNGIPLTRLHAQNRSTKLMISSILALRKWSI
jgi:ATP sulfurylase